MHFGHANIIRYCNRPFADVTAMNAALVKNWNEVVGPDDEVWVLGDVALGSIHDMLALVRGLAGHKVLVAGNHDRCWAAAGPKSVAWESSYREAGFAEIHQGVVDVVFDGAPALACHFPYQGDSHDDDRFVPLRPVDAGMTLLHGHVHERWKVSGHQVNVGVDVWDFRPVTDTQLVAALAAQPKPPLSSRARRSNP